MHSKYFHPLVVSEIKKLTKDCVQVSFAIPNEFKKEFTFLPGQYITFEHQFGKESLRRSYSICSIPEDENISVAIKHISGGKFSTYANKELKTGAILNAMKPTGNFLIPSSNSSKNHIVLFAAGSGITPIISIIKQLLKSQVETSISLFYGNRNTESIIFREELEALKNKFLSRFDIHYVFSKEKIGSPLFYGRIDNLKCNKFSGVFFNTQEVDSFMLCGPSEMIFSVKQSLTNLGVDSQKIHFELFNTDGIQKTETKTEEITKELLHNQSQVSIKMDGDIFDFKLEYGGLNLLDAALKNGADLPYACKGGVCSTCKAKLTSGEVSMDINYALEPDELEAGYILMCQAHPRSQQISIDYDQK
jgi:ring-1,2-phenylacetyl-CoA epoxidase subunit PaaE